MDAAPETRPPGDFRQLPDHVQKRRGDAREVAEDDAASFHFAASVRLVFLPPLHRFPDVFMTISEGGEPT